MGRQRETQCRGRRRSPRHQNALDDSLEVYRPTCLVFSSCRGMHVYLLRGRKDCGERLGCRGEVVSHQHWGRGISIEIGSGGWYDDG